MKKTLTIRDYGLAHRNPVKHDGSDWSDSRFFVWREGGPIHTVHPDLAPVKPRYANTYAIDCETWDVFLYHRNQWVLVANTSTFHEAWRIHKRENVAFEETRTLRRMMDRFPHLFTSKAKAALEELERAHPQPVFPPFSTTITFEL